METTTGKATAEGQASKRCCPISVTVVRLLMGLAFFVFGLNGFLQFMPQPKEMPEAITSIMGAFMKTGFMFPLIFGTQLLVGVLLLVNRFVPLALALIAPVLVNIIFFHLFLQPSGIAPGALLSVFEIYLAWAYRDVYRPMLAARVVPGGACASPNQNG